MSMNFNIYLNNDIGEKVGFLAKKLHRSRNSIVSEALEEWVARHSTSWPENFFQFEAMDVPDFTSFRKGLKDLSEDP